MKSLPMRDSGMVDGACERFEDGLSRLRRGVLPFLLKYGSEVACGRYVRELLAEELVMEVTLELLPLKTLSHKVVSNTTIEQRRTIAHLLPGLPGYSRGPLGTRTFSRSVLRRRWLKVEFCSGCCGLEADAGMVGLRKVEASLLDSSPTVLWNLRRTCDSASSSSVAAAAIDMWY